MKSLKDIQVTIERVLEQYLPGEDEDTLIIGISADRAEEAVNRLKKELGGDCPVSSQDLRELRSLEELARRLSRRISQQERRGFRSR
ncbi:MAG: hypothetical protein WC309_02205 [Candidatus Paceibacterota bacterium]|jgi:pyruvate-formate lyase